jgi:hypothetical protein
VTYDGRERLSRGARRAAERDNGCPNYKSEREEACHAVEPPSSAKWSLRMQTGVLGGGGRAADPRRFGRNRESVTARLITRIFQTAPRSSCDGPTTFPSPSSRGAYDERPSTSRATLFCVGCCAHVTSSVLSSLAGFRAICSLLRRSWEQQTLPLLLFKARLIGQASELLDSKRVGDCQDGNLVASPFVLEPTAMPSTSSRRLRKFLKPHVQVRIR